MPVTDFEMVQEEIIYMNVYSYVFIYVHMCVCA